MLGENRPGSANRPENVAMGQLQQILKIVTPYIIAIYTIQGYRASGGRLRWLPEVPMVYFWWLYVRLRWWFPAASGSNN